MEVYSVIIAYLQKGIHPFLKRNNFLKILLTKLYYMIYSIVK